MCRAAETGKLQVLQRVPCNGKQNGRTQCRLGWCWAVLDSAPMVWSLLPQPCHTPDSLSAVPIAVWSQCSWRNSRPVSSLAVDLVKLMVCCSAHMYLEPISFEQHFYLTMSKTDFIWIQTKSVIVSATNWVELTLPTEQKWAKLSQTKVCKWKQTNHNNSCSSKPVIYFAYVSLATSVQFRLFQYFSFLYWSLIKAN